MKKTIFFICIILISLIKSAFASTSGALEYTDVTKILSARYGSEYTAPFTLAEDNVDLGMGAVAISETDLSLSGKSGLDVNVVRKYSSGRLNKDVIKFIGGSGQKQVIKYIGAYFKYADGTSYPYPIIFNSESEIPDEIIVTSNSHTVLRDFYNRSYVVYSSIAYNHPSTIKLYLNLNSPVIEINILQSGVKHDAYGDNELGIQLGNNWELSIPGVEYLGYYIDYFGVRLHHFNMQSLQGNAVTFIVEIRSNGQPYGDPYSKDNNYLLERASNTLGAKLTHTSGFEYDFVAYDMYGNKYYLDMWQTVAKHKLCAIEDKYGNLIRYEYDAATAVTTITDTLNRKITVSKYGIEVKENNTLLNEIIYSYPPSVPIPKYASMGIDFRKTVEFSVSKNNGTEVTRYIMKPRGVTFGALVEGSLLACQTLLEKVIYPTGGESRYSYTHASARDDVVSYGLLAVTQHQKIDSEENIEVDKAYSYKGTYTKPITTERVYVNNNIIKDTEYTYDKFYRLKETKTSSDLTSFTYSYNDTTSASLAAESTLQTRKQHYIVNSQNKLASSTNFTYDNYRRLTSEATGNVIKTYAYSEPYITRSLINNVIVTNKAHYSMLTKETITTNVGTTLETINTLTPDAKGIGSSVVSKKVGNNVESTSQTDFSYYSDGTLATQTQYPSNNINDMLTTAFTYNYNTSPYSKITTATTAGISTSQYFDKLGRMIKTTDGEGNSTEFEYDLMNRIKRKINPQAFGETAPTEQLVDYDLQNNTTIVTDENGNKIKTVYTSFGKEKEIYIKEKENPYKLVSSNSYDIAGRPTVSLAYIDDIKYLTQTMTYDTSDRIINSTTRDNTNVILQSATFDYAVSATADSKNYYQSITKLTQVGDSTYTPPIVEVTDNYLGQSISEKIWNGSTPTQAIVTNTYEYDYAGNLLESKTGEAALNNWAFSTKTEYNMFNQPVKQYHPETTAAFAQMVYDRMGRVTEQYDFKGNKTEYQYDQAGRLKKIISPFEGNIVSETINEYDDNGNLTLKKVQSNKPGQPTAYTQTAFEYDQRNRLIVQISYDGITPIYTQYKYDNVGNVLKTITGLTYKINDFNNLPDGAKAEEYEYNMFGSVIRAIDAEGQETTAEYNLMQLPTASTDRNGVTTVTTYNAHGLPLTINAGNEPQIAYTYNMSGLVKSVASNGKTAAFEYDKMGNISKEIETGGTTYTKTYTYDLNGNRKTFELKAGTTTQISQAYEYYKTNALKLVRKSGSQIAQYTYDLNGNMTLKTAGTQTVTYTYNKANMLTALNNGAGLPGYSYTYYLNGMQESKTDSINGVTSYVYDTLGQLKTETTPDFTTNYTYDVRGNRLTKQTDGITTDYVYNLNNRLLSESKIEDNITDIAEYFYDPNGNMKYKAYSRIEPENGQPATLELSENSPYLEQFEYDSFNRLTKLTKDDTIAVYSYAANGMRSGKTVNGVTTTHVWDGMNIVYENVSDAGNLQNNLIAKYYRGMGIISSDVNNATNYYIFNGHGDTVALKGSSSVIAGYTYDAFGQELDGVDGVYNPFRYSGEYADIESGMIYLRARYYDPGLGRFISEDPIKDGVNWYVYCMNNPVNRWDPTGLVIELKGDTDQQKEFLDGLQELTGLKLFNDSGIVGIGGFCYKNSQPKETELLIDMINREELTTIEFDISKDSKAHNTKINPGNVDVKITINPSQSRFVRVDQSKAENFFSSFGLGNIDFENATSFQETPFGIYLGHELIHAKAILENRDKISGSTSQYFNEYGIQQDVQTSDEELYTIGIISSKYITENDLRDEVGLPNRVTHIR